jgi:hypothetical protein
MAKKASASRTAAGGRKRAAAGRTPGKAARGASSGRKTKTAKKKVASRRPAAGGAKGRGARSSGTGASNARSAGRKAAAAKGAARTARPKGKAAAARSRRPAASAKRGGSAAPAPAKGAPRSRGRGLERTLAQTPETGRSVGGRTNPMPTKRSTGTAAGAGSTANNPGLERARRELREVEEHVPGPPSSLDLDRTASSARSGRRELQQARRDHNETSPVMTAGDVDADWEEAYAVGDEAPGGDNPTPDQDRVDDIGKALGVEYEDNEELKASEKITERDRHRWELDPASSEDYPDRD